MYNFWTIPRLFHCTHQVGYDKRNDLDSVSEMKAFVSEDLKELKQQHKSLEQHLNSCEAIVRSRKQDNFEVHFFTYIWYDVNPVVDR